MSLDQIWPIADFVTVHVPLIKPTRGAQSMILNNINIKARILRQLFPKVKL